MSVPTQPIKHNAGAKTTGCCIRKNNYDVGVVTSYPYGPTSTTDFWAGYNVPSGGFVTFQDKVSQGPSIYSIPSFNDLVSFGNNMNLGSISSGGYLIRICANLPDVLLVNILYPELPQIDNNILSLDAGYTPSYGWGGSEWFDFSSNNGGAVTQATLTGGTAFVTGSSVYNYSDSYLNMAANTQNAWAVAPSFSSALQNFTINVWVRIITGNGYLSNQNVVGQQYATTGAYVPQTNCNFLIRGNGTNGYEGVIRLSGVDYTVDFGPVAAGWRNLTLTYDGAQLRSYVDGNFANNSSGPGVTLVSNGLSTLIGGTTNAVANTGTVQNYLNAGIGVVNIWDYALDDTQINNLSFAYSNQRAY